MVDEWIIESLQAYVDNGRPVGSFLQAVLENDLEWAFIRADLECTINMRDIVAYCYTKLPAGCRGSRQAVAEWFKKKHSQSAQEKTS